MASIGPAGPPGPPGTPGHEGHRGHRGRPGYDIGPYTQPKVIVKETEEKPSKYPQFLQVPTWAVGLLFVMLLLVVYKKI